jgi:hypothetical protein
MGKTLTFWLPLLSCPYGIQIVVTPLNILGQQNVDTLSKFSVHGVFVSAKTASKEFFDVRNVFIVLSIILICDLAGCSPHEVSSHRCEPRGTHATRGGVPVSIQEPAFCPCHHRYNYRRSALRNALGIILPRLVPLHYLRASCLSMGEPCTSCP